MRFEISPKALAEAAKRAFRVIDEKHNMAAVTCVRLEARDGTLYVDATNLNETIRGSVPVDLHTPGVALVNAKLLKELSETLRQAPAADDAKVMVTDHGDAGASFRLGKTMLAIEGLPVDTFPALPGHGVNSRVWPVDPVVLANALGYVSFAASDDLSRHNLCGVFVEPKGENGGFSVTATNGHCLANATYIPQDAPGGAYEPHPMLVPTDAVDILRREMVLGSVVSVEDNNVAVRNGDWLTLARLVDANFPDYRQLLPKHYDHEIKIEPNTINASLRRIGVLNDTKSRGVSVEITRDGISLEIMGDPKKGAKATDEVECEGFDGDSITFGASATYLIDAFAHVGELALLRYRGATMPLIIVPGGASDGLNVLQLVMPMKL
jgi:DNA polymerase-3 subunit beta